MKYILHILFLILTTALLAQAPSKFYTRIGGNGYDYGYDIKQTLDKGYIFTGSTTSFGQTFPDLYLTKLDSMGQVKFQKYIGNASNEIGKSVIQLSDSSFVIAGYTNSIGFGGYDVYLVKTDKAGNMMWAKTYGGQDWDFAYSLQQTQDGGFVIGGTTYSMGRGGADGYIIKTDANGVEQWHKTYGGINDDEFKSVIQTNDGNYALTGYTKSYNDIDSGDVWIFKLDTNGDSLWCKFYGGNKEDFGNGIIQLQNLNLFVAGGTKSFSVNYNIETIVMSYDLSNGNLLYNYRDVSSQTEYYNCTVQGINGTIVNCGATNNAVSGFDGLVDMYSSSFGYVNFFSTGSNDIEELYGVSKTQDKGFVAIGKTSGYGAILDDVFILKMDSVGSYGINITSINKNDLALKSINIFPNPASTFLNISMKTLNLNNNIKCTFSDINARIILEKQIDSEQSVINISELSAGLYFIQLFDNERLIETKKLSIIK